MRREHIEVLYYAFILEEERLSELTRGRLLRTFHRNADRAAVAPGVGRPAVEAQATSPVKRSPFSNIAARLDILLLLVSCAPSRMTAKPTPCEPHTKSAQPNRISLYELSQVALAYRCEESERHSSDGHSGQSISHRSAQSASFANNYDTLERLLLVPFVDLLLQQFPT
ncbi:hypothetical protein BGW80DRAFT_660202 [Lactifluus volemus]|nr:hypothetical protein BGW80DRAFT_660202 [Lactifluus volemus]